jgi:uncharacterized membrane protein (UPF0182 family)
VADEQRLVWADTLGQALDLLTSGQASTTTSNPTPGQPTTNPTVADLIKRINDLYADAQNKKSKGDIKGYVDDIDQMGALIQQLQQVQGGGGSSPTPGVSPSPSR